MKILDLRNKVCLTAPSGMDYVAVGPITLQPHSRAYRIVLMVFEDREFAVFTEYFPFNVPLDELKDYDQGDFFTERGDYFKPEKFPEAVAKFAERVAEQVEYTRSIYRDMETTTTKNIKFTNIQWDTDGEEVTLPTDVTLDVDNDLDLDTDGANVLSDAYGWCVISFDWEEVA